MRRPSRQGSPLHTPSFPSFRPLLRPAAGAALLAAALSASVVSGAAWAQSAPAGTAAAGQKKNSMCVGCHGIPDYHTAYPVVYHVPKIAGQSQQYIISALRAYKAGDRTHPSMRGIAGQMSDQDMADLAAYYGRQEGAAK